MTPEQRPSVSFSGTRRIRSDGGEAAHACKNSVASCSLDGGAGHSGHVEDRRATCMGAIGGVGDGDLERFSEVLAFVRFVGEAASAEDEDEADRFDMMASVIAVGEGYRTQAAK